jgi:hypothetical protein
MKRFRLHLPGFLVAAWVMASVTIAIAYALCLGTAEAAVPPPHKAPPHQS